MVLHRRVIFARSAPRFLLQTFYLFDKFSSAALRSRNAIAASNHLLPAAQHVRPFSSGPSSDLDTEFEGLTAQRNKSIIMNPAGQGQHILPGGFILKKDPKKGEHRRVFVVAWILLGN
jgi:hypothetical protein